MKLSTGRGNHIRQYFIDLDNLAKEYSHYQQRPAKSSVQTLINEIKALPYQQTAEASRRAEILENNNPIGCVYFIYEATTNESPTIFKIGWTTHLPTRLATLQTANWRPLALWRRIFAFAELEHYFHQMFAAQRIAGEWFRLSGEIINALEII